jgi:hypothetical protein
MTHLSRALLILAAVLGFAYVQKLVALALVDRRLMASGGTGHGFEDAGCTGTNGLPHMVERSTFTVSGGMRHPLVRRS